MFKKNIKSKVLAVINDKLDKAQDEHDATIVEMDEEHEKAKEAYTEQVVQELIKKII